MSRLPVSSPGVEGLASRSRHRPGPSRVRVVLVGLGLGTLVTGIFVLALVGLDGDVELGAALSEVFGGGDRSTRFIVGRVRLPRALTALAAGAALGTSGAVFQSLARNPLASPDLIGVTAGASAAAVAVIVASEATGAMVTLAALVGALASAALVAVLGLGRGRSDSRLVLVGVGVSAGLMALTALMLTRSRSQDAHRATVWITGSLNARDWVHVRPVVASLLVATPVLVGALVGLRALELGDDVSAGIGVPTTRVRAMSAVAAVVLAAGATAAAGPVAFVALMAPPIGRRLVRTSPAVGVSGLVGAALLIGADAVGREVLGPPEAPVGAVTGVLGGAYLLMLLIRGRV